MNMYFAVDKIAANFVDQLIETIEVAVLKNDNLFIYALVDTSFEYAQPRPRESSWKVLTTSLYENSDFEGLLEASPYLVPIQGTRENKKITLRKLVIACSGMPMLSFIASSSSASELNAFFKPFLEIRVEDEQGFLLRLADTRILPVLDAILCKEKTPGWRNGISQWWLPDRAGNLISLPDYASGQPINDSDKKCLSVSQTLFNQLMDAGESDAILDAISDQNPDLLKNHRPSEAHRLIKRLSIPINNFRIVNFSDVVMFCTTALATAEYFYTEKNFNAILSSASWVPGKLGDAFALIDDLAWSEIATMNKSINT